MVNLTEVYESLSEEEQAVFGPWGGLKPCNGRGVCLADAQGNPVAELVSSVQVGCPVFTMEGLQGGRYCICSQFLATSGPTCGDVTTESIIAGSILVGNFVIDVLALALVYKKAQQVASQGAVRIRTGLILSFLGTFGILCELIHTVSRVLFNFGVLNVTLMGFNRLSGACTLTLGAAVMFMGALRWLELGRSGRGKGKSPKTGCLGLLLRIQWILCAMFLILEVVVYSLGLGFVATGASAAVLLLSAVMYRVGATSTLKAVGKTLTECRNQAASNFQRKRMAALRLHLRLATASSLGTVVCLFVLQFFSPITTAHTYKAPVSAAILMFACKVCYCALSIVVSTFALDTILARVEHETKLSSTTRGGNGLASTVVPSSLLPSATTQGGQSGSGNSEQARAPEPTSK